MNTSRKTKLNNSPENKRWVIITGASHGIAKALVFEFAAGGFNLFLVSRDKSALEKVAADCKQQFDTEARVYAADLSNSDSTDSLINALSQPQYEFDILVNNAGFGVKGSFADTDIDQELRLMNLQLGAMLKLTKAVLPQMISRKTGRILNIASVYSFAPVPFQAVYSACKAFMMSFSTLLANELNGTGVTVTTIYPGITQTEFRARAGIAEKNKNPGMTA